MRAAHVVLCLAFGVGACATPGQVRRVETAVALADRDRARGDSAERAELARIEIMQRQAVDSMVVLYRQLSDFSQRLSREQAAGFDDLRQRLYQVVAAQSSVVQNVNRLRNQVDAAVTSGPPVSALPDTGRPGGAVGIPQPNLLIDHAKEAIFGSNYPTARRALNQLLTSYPQAAEVPEAYYWLGYSFDAPESADSARYYYKRVFTAYPKADKASTALYKLGNLELKAGNRPLARQYWQQVLRDYKDSPEFDPAQQALRDNP